MEKLTQLEGARVWTCTLEMVGQAFHGHNGVRSYLSRNAFEQISARIFMESFVQCPFSQGVLQLPRPARQSSARTERPRRRQHPRSLHLQRLRRLHQRQRPRSQRHRSQRQHRRSLRQRQCGQRQCSQRQCSQRQCSQRRCSQRQLRLFQLPLRLLQCQLQMCPPAHEQLGPWRGPAEIFAAVSTSVLAIPS